MSTHIKARYEKGAFRPLEDVDVKEGTEADVYLRAGKGNGGDKTRKATPSLEDFEVYGMWKDRRDFKDGTDYVNRSRKYRK